MEYMTALEAATKWNISKRRVQILCARNRINGAIRLGNMWVIPKDATKPADRRRFRYECKGDNDEGRRTD